MPIHFLRNCFFRTLLAAVFISIAAATAFAQEPQAQQLSPMEALAGKAAAAIAQDSKDEHAKMKVLVVNFLEEGRKPTELSSTFADAFADSLGKQAPNFEVISRDDYWRAAAQDKVSADTLSNIGVSKCYGAQLAADYTSVGSLEYMSNVVVVEMTVYHNKDHEKIFGDAASIAYTPEMQSLLARPVTAPAVSASSPSDKSNSRNPDGATGSGDRKEAPSGGTKGFTMPSCLYCPRPDYSDEAVKGKLSGVILLNVQIGSNGSAENISVIHGEPCGMNQMAVDAVAHWKFKPANGPDGSPAAVTVPIEVNFSLY